MVATSPLKIVAADDDARMREFYRAVLQHLGHTVLGVAAHGYELLELSLRVADPIDLLITDVRMPVMSGVEAACIIAERRPLPVLFVSAFPEDVLSVGIALPFAHRLLTKPIGMAELAAEVPLATRRM